MAKDLGDAIGSALGHAAREAAQTVASNARKSTKNGSLSGAKGLAAGAGLALLVPLAAKGAGKLAAWRQGDRRQGPEGRRRQDRRQGRRRGRDCEEGCEGRAARAARQGCDPGRWRRRRREERRGGRGKGRRMPVQQSVDVARPLETAYNQWTQFEDWPKFMHRSRASRQEDDCTVSFATKIWGKTEGVQGRDRDAASRRAHQVEGLRGHHAHRRRDLP